MLVKRIIGVVLVLGSVAGLYFVIRTTLDAPPALADEPRVIILGFDGVDPGIVETMMAAGELPNLQALQSRGTYTRLASTNPPQSPTAWSSFATCKHPGDHGIFDFLRRIPERYIPAVGFGSVTPFTLAADGTVAREPAFKSRRKGQSFWQAANEQGARCKILSVPFAFPAEELTDSSMLCGLGVPDLRGSTSVNAYMSETITQVNSVAGGDRIPLRFTDNVARVKLTGLRNPKLRADVTVPITIIADREAKSVRIDLPEKSLSLEEGTWSEWVEWTFDVTPQFSARAISRFHLLEAGANVRLYMTCLQYHPDDAFIRFTTPESYASELSERYGFFKTIGWSYDTHAVRQDVLPEDLFLQDVQETMKWREMLTLDEIDRGNFDLLVSAWTGTDRVSHLFWRFRDPLHPLYTEEGAAKYGRAVEDTYKHMDAIVGKVAEKLREDDLLMVMSDHGFHSYRTGFNVNTWLIRNGYLSVTGHDDPATAYNDKDFLRGYNWNGSKAYSVGLGSIFLNIKGREGKGTVAPEDAQALIAELREKLLDVTDPASGTKIFSAISTRDDYKGESQADAPDLQLGYNEGFQSSKSTAKGAAPMGLFEENDDKWSGEHAASDPLFTAGILFANTPLSVDDPSLIDLGVTAITYLGANVPEDFDGRDLLAR